jgi:GntR family transcriptional regulator / MocR family aminotransferase
MPRRTTTFELMLPPRDRADPAFRWLYAALRDEILAGRLRPGARLPATRDLAAQYSLSRGTIVSAFEQLTAEGYLVGTVGSGTYVSEVLPEELLEVSRTARRSASTASHLPRALSDFATRLPLGAKWDIRSGRAFRTDLQAIDLFPVATWAQIAARRLRKLSHPILLGSEPLGFQPLREAVAGYLTTSRGVKCDADQVTIVSGVQDALDLIARLVLNEGDRVCMEDPGYQGAAHVFESLGATIHAVPLDEQGMRLPPKRLKGVKLAYVTPAHQFPIGMTMTLARRLELLEWARSSGALIFEDDYDSEYRYSGRPVPALQGLDTSGSVVFFGTFNKVLFPSLRIAYVVLPRDLIPYVAASIHTTRRHAPVLDQAILSDFMTEGHFARHLRRMRKVYAERHAVLLERAEKHLAGLLDVSPIEAGLQTIGWLPEGIDSDEAARAASANGIDVTPLSRFRRTARTRDGLQLGFASVDPKEIRRGVRELAKALESLMGRAHPGVLRRTQLDERLK